MAPMALALILGWCLVAASRAQQLPRPSLSLHPSQGVSLRDSVTLWCHLPRPAARVELYKEGERTFKMSRDTDKEQDAVEFYLADIKQEDAVKYQCQYRVLEPPGTSEKSDPVALLVTDRSYPPPTISLSPEEHVEMGTNVTIRCWNKPYQGFTFLHKDGHSDPIQHQEPDGGGTATFTLFRVSPADSGTYRCSYRVGGCCLLFSPLGDNVTLEVIPTPAFPGRSQPPIQCSPCYPWVTVSLHPSSIVVGAGAGDTSNTWTPQVTLGGPDGTWWQQWRGAALLPLSSSSSSPSLSSSLPTEDGYKEMRALVPSPEAPRLCSSRCPPVTARV
ncbi:leukocyte immunoglobulin-like receptor subfamily A member 6 isoform X1 [Numida meleagris]|uniref:leukocyte immunoglobulin-like receptor subfamily A member 6 isoform X1 n=1 Tax=Numida meleagris TaxID=8996 RepID=UPI000B3DFA35|nr:leukocyte immunoglobulin-like receptor subfamily A member 6 isoform X1 [Numida meleagris]